MLLEMGSYRSCCFFNKEIEGLEKFNLDIKSKLIISRKAHLIYLRTVY
jgi:hypothetical protein